VLGQPLAHEQPSAVHARIHGRDVDLEDIGDGRLRCALDVVQDQRGPIVRWQRIDGRGDDHSQLTLHCRLVDPRRPVVHRLEMSVRGERGHDVIRDRGPDVLPPLEPLVGRAAYRPIDPGSERRLVHERGDRMAGRQQGLLDNFLGIVLDAGDAQGKLVDACGVALDELLGAVGIVRTRRHHSDVGITHARLHASISLIRSASVQTADRADAGRYG
jgi:hypothetical protein